MILDATAGNRQMWKNKNPPNVVFMDRETRLNIPPNIFGDYRQPPFRNDVFECVIFDPPFMSRLNPPKYWNDPEQKLHKTKKGFTQPGQFWGVQLSKSELLGGLHKASGAFSKLTNRLCLKWSEIDYSIWKILPFFKEWKIIQKNGFKQHRDPKTGLFSHSRSSEDKNCKTWWITFIKSQFKEKPDISECGGNHD